MSPWVRVEGKLSVSGPKQINPDRRTLEQQCGALPSLGPAAVFYGLLRSGHNTLDLCLSPRHHHCINRVSNLTTSPQYKLQTTSPHYKLQTTSPHYKLQTTSTHYKLQTTSTHYKLQTQSVDRIHRSGGRELGTILLLISFITITLVLPYQLREGLNGIKL